MIPKEHIFRTTTQSVTHASLWNRYIYHGCSLDATCGLNTLTVNVL